ncbi:MULTISPECIES: helix-turn-helix domain-containing protein [unclassified Bradyrhizobium]|uniref:helix-turn-helix domain-containing protein n=1 Tax=unclassified Bradyrhizobium TaxID=2631580 RepID=UPI001FF8162F|nr:MULTISPECIES: helix-turn-helix domain-containing protein [unclassified Bradyrhizobium]MCK1715904.1 helix-turn-helix domain-containing protein [Bradyrhizobium sp. 143]MCK1725701.1 helix-turn-helix domain-containing protein [Bradyrhizobium sp. 142]
MQLNEALRTAPVTTFDTRVVPPTDRISYWEEQCGEYVVGLTCSSLEADGLQARFRYVDLGAIKLVDITGHQHVVERLPVHLRTREKDSVFLTLLVSGAAFVNRANECVLLNEGDVVLYDTNRPYMHGFPGFMRHVMFEVSGNEFRQRFPGWDLRAARRYDSSIGAGRQISTSLRQIITHYSPFSGMATGATEIEEKIWNVLRMAQGLSRGAERSTYHSLVMDRVHQFIAANLRDPNLSPEMIAEHAGISVRQLNRLFAGEPDTLIAHIFAMRLDACRTDLRRRDTEQASVSEIAYSWGFRNVSHFSRNFRERFGCTPSESRAR